MGRSHSRRTGRARPPSRMRQSPGPGWRHPRRSGGRPGPGRPGLGSRRRPTSSRSTSVSSTNEGRPVLDLEAEDFVLEEDGVAQKIEEFQSVAAPEGAASEPWLASRVSTNLGATAAPRRTFVVVFDDIHLSEAGAARARAAARGVPEGPGPGRRGRRGLDGRRALVQRPHRSGHAKASLAALQRLKGLRPAGAARRRPDHRLRGDAHRPAQRLRRAQERRGPVDARLQALGADLGGGRRPRGVRRSAGRASRARVAPGRPSARPPARPRRCRPWRPRSTRRRGSGGSGPFGRSCASSPRSAGPRGASR